MLFDQDDAVNTEPVGEDDEKVGEGGFKIRSSCDSQNDIYRSGGLILRSWNEMTSRFD